MYKLLLKYNYHFNIQNHSFQLLYLYILFYISFIYKSEPIQKRLSQIKIQLNLYYSFPLPKATFHFWRSQTITSPQVTFHFCEANLSPRRSRLNRLFFNSYWLYYFFVNSNYLHDLLWSFLSWSFDYWVFNIFSI